MKYLIYSGTQTLIGDAVKYMYRLKKKLKIIKIYYFESTLLHRVVVFMYGIPI